MSICPVLASSYLAQRATQSQYWTHLNLGVKLARTWTSLNLMKMFTCTQGLLVPVHPRWYKFLPGQKDCTVTCSTSQDKTKGNKQLYKKRWTWLMAYASSQLLYLRYVFVSPENHFNGLSCSLNLSYVCVFACIVLQYCTLHSHERYPNKKEHNFFSESFRKAVMHQILICRGLTGWRFGFSTVCRVVFSAAGLMRASLLVFTCPRRWLTAASHSLQ